MNPEIISAYQFFRKHAGYVVGENAKGALQLAKAEAAFREAGGTFEWTFDDDADCSFVDTWPEKERQLWYRENHCIEGCIALFPNNKRAASLWGIIDADDNYRRVVQAELAMEALDNLVNSGAKCCVSCHQSIY